MGEVNITPYLFFSGNCKEAMEFYKSVFGGELSMQTMAEAPKEAQMPGANPTDVMHARLKGTVDIMASDSGKASDHTAKIELSINGRGADEAKLRPIFDKLAEGGQVKMPLTKMFWGDMYGQLTDKYGIDWMMNIGDSMA